VLRLIQTLPLLAAVLLPLLGGGAVAFAGKLYVDWIAIPQAVRVAEARLTAEYERRVVLAIQEEQLRQFKIIERLQAEAAAELEEERAWWQAKNDLLEGEIEAYEKGQGDEAYRLDQDDLDFLARSVASGVRIDTGPRAARSPRGGH
jgi:hypothetical protein